ncbi:hypothetical protein ES705_22441 [subsurface metagenome]
MEWILVPVAVVVVAIGIVYFSYKREKRER